MEIHHPWRSAWPDWPCDELGGIPRSLSLMGEGKGEGPIQQTRLNPNAGAKCKSPV